MTIRLYKGKKWSSPYLSLLNYNINNTEIGWIYFNDEMYDKSVMYFNKIAALNPKNSEGFYGLAYAQYKLNKLKDSKINCETALQLDPDNENALALKKMLKGK